MSDTHPADRRFGVQTCRVAGGPHFPQAPNFQGTLALSALLMGAGGAFPEVFPFGQHSISETANALPQVFAKCTIATRKNQATLSAPLVSGAGIGVGTRSDWSLGKNGETKAGAPPVGPNGEIPALPRKTSPEGQQRHGGVHQGECLRSLIPLASGAGHLDTSAILSYCLEENGTDGGQAVLVDTKNPPLPKLRVGPV